MSKIALVTSASRGLGLETARRLGRREGYTVIVGAREAAAGERAVAELREQGVDAEMVRLDVTSPAGVAEAADRVGARHGRLDVLVNSKTLADTPIKVNSVCPGWLQTDLGGAGNRAAAPTPAAEGAEVVIDAAGRTQARERWKRWRSRGPYEAAWSCPQPHRCSDSERKARGERPSKHAASRFRWAWSV